MARLVVIYVHGVDRDGRDRQPLFIRIVQHAELVVVALAGHFQQPFGVVSRKAAQSRLVVGEIMPRHKRIYHAGQSVAHF